MHPVLGVGEASQNFYCIKYLTHAVLPRMSVNYPTTTPPEKRVHYTRGATTMLFARNVSLQGNDKKTKVVRGETFQS